MPFDTRLERVSRLIGDRRWKYVIGEILITTVGILIALALNAWWQQHLDRQAEADLLSEMRSGLAADTMDMRDDQIAYAAVRGATLALDSAFEGHAPYAPGMDSLFGIQVLFRNHLSTASAWQTLKLRGVRLVADDSLRLRIISYYEYGKSHIAGWNTADGKLVDNVVRPYYRRNFHLYGGHGTQARARPIRYEFVANDTDYRYLLVERRDALNSALAVYDASFNDARWLIARIDARLAQLGRSGSE